MALTKLFLGLSLAAVLLAACGRAGPPVITKQLQNHKFILDPLLN
ncbi:MAG: hypothetical protein QWI73_00305 [Alphaproteobacteria bacterium]|nr:hypothetical protein [Alphaproteobacteria bacterium]